MSARPIETEYAGYRFRSRLEARWAVFFDAAGIPWRYEPEGYQLSTGWYLPDFHLPECDTWIEVKGDPNRLDEAQMRAAAMELPRLGHLPGCEQGPALMILGDIPEELASGDWGWIGLEPVVGFPTEGGDLEVPVCAVRYGFGTYEKNRRPWYLDNAQDGEPWLTPTFDPYEWNIGAAYRAARAARFEHGETPAPRERPTRPRYQRQDASYLLGVANPFADVRVDPQTGEIDPW